MRCTPPKSCGGWRPHSSSVHATLKAESRWKMTGATMSQGAKSCLVEATSVRHEATDGAAREKLSRHAAEDQLAEPAMSIAARDQKVRVLLFGNA